MKKNTALYIIALLLVVAGGACGSRDKTPLSNIQQPLDSIFSAMFADDEPGAIVLVAKGDDVIYNEGFGLADIKKGIPMSDSALLNICSISKQFSAIALLKMQEEGILSLDDSLPKFFPDLKQPFYKNVTLRHLLTHSSGIPDLRPRTRDEWYDYTKKHHSMFSSVEDYRLYSLTKESTAYLTTLNGLNFEPGTAYEYENPTYQLVQTIVRNLSRRKFSEWMDSTFFTPAGMTHTDYIDPAKEQSHFSHAYIRVSGPNRRGYYRSPDGKWEECDYGEADFFPTKADGGLYTSAREFLKWERALFGGKLISEESLKEALTHYIGTDIPLTDYGLGFFLESTPAGEKIYHTGDNGGFLTVEAYYPEDDVFYLVFANRPDWNRDKTVESIDSILYSNCWLNTRYK